MTSASADGVDSLAYTQPFQLTKMVHRSVPDMLQPERPENSQKGKIVVITGGGSGIGAAAAKVWTRAGAEGVVIAGRRKNVLDDTAQSLNDLAQGKTKVLAVQTDLINNKSVANLYDEVQKAFGRPADVVIACAGLVNDLKPLADEDPKTWWSVFELTILGLHNAVAAFINSQTDPKNPVGTIISVNSGLAGLVEPGFSAYAIAKMAAHRYMEFVHTEYPSLRSFTLLPGIVVTDLLVPDYMPYAKDQPEQTGALCLYLATDRADYLKGSLTSINWDLETMEAHEPEIEKGLLKMSWVPVLPCSGGSGI